jgi:putative DNA primase/helicase
MAYIEFLEGQKHSGNLTDTADTPDGFKDAGYLLTDQDLVIDIDNLGKDHIEAMIKAFNIRTQVVWTRRGAHLYFKKPQGFRRAQGICALGFPVEYKHNGNTKAITVKLNGQLRDTDNFGVREDMPWYLNTAQQYKDLLGMGDGDGRNNALYSAKRGMNNQPHWQTAVRFINEHVFAEPLPEKEVESIARFEAVPEASKNNEFAVAEYLIKDLDYLRYGGNFYYKERGEEKYKADEPRLIQIIYDMCPGVQTRYIDEVIKQMQYRCRIVPNDTVFKIRFNNGYLQEGEFIPIKTDEFTPYMVDSTYNPDAEPVEIVDRYISHLTKNESEYRNLLMEVLGHCFIVNPEFKRLLAKFFIFVGSGGNGKGTLLQIIKGILGAENVTGMSIKELSDERYLSTLKGKLANLGDDIQDSAIDNKDMKVLKNITTCDYMSSRELYKQAESMYFTASLIFTSNHLIKSFEKGKSYKRRVMWLPMYTEVKEENKDPLFITKLTTPESVEYWIRLIVDGYMRLYKNLRFTTSPVVEAFNEEYHEENNPYLIYFKDIDMDTLIDLPIKDGYDRAEEWCRDNKIEFNKNMFRETLLEVYGVRTDGVKKINGATTRVFKKAEDST